MCHIHFWYIVCLCVCLEKVPRGIRLSLLVLQQMRHIQRTSFFWVESSLKHFRLDFLCISMLSGAESDTFGSWQAGSVCPWSSAQYSRAEPYTSLPPATVFCLFTHQPPIVSVRVYVYHNYCALQPPIWLPCSPSPPLPSMLPNLTWHELRFLFAITCRFACCWPYHLRSILPFPVLRVIIS